MNKRKIIISDGVEAVYKNGGEEIPVVICNVENDHGMVFNAKDTRTNSLISRGDQPRSWGYGAIEKGTFVIKDPKFEEDSGADELDDEPDADAATLEQISKLREFFEGSVRFGGHPFALDDEQLAAVLSDQNTLVTARAGSGKTRVLVAKLIYLFEKQKLNQNNVLAFCFNRDASAEICDRLQNKCLVEGKSKYQNYDVAHTFHAFSTRALQLGGAVLVDRKPLIKMIINDLKADPAFARDVYDFFRNDTLKIDKKRFKSPETYYKYIKNIEYTTLNGEKVRSKAEKYIADYLFEHGIKYFYEWSFYPNKISFFGAKMPQEELERCRKLANEKKSTKPDFYLPDYGIIWEHWGVTGDEDDAEIDNFEKTVGKYDEYLRNKEWKQEFWGRDWRRRLAGDSTYNKAIKSIKELIETANRDFSRLSRSEAESKIEEFLRRHGIYAQKLPQTQLVQMVWDKSIDGFTDLIEQFINKLQQNYFDCLDKFVADIKAVQDEKTRVYYELGLKAYKRYVEILASDTNAGKYAKYNNFAFDFNQIIYKCSQAIRAGEMDSTIKDIKWLLIDEYQDFSRLFDYLVNSLIERNRQIKVFCVGDDWQAINRFAGSDLKYFNNFSKNYPDAKLCNITTNYRSENHIVEFANKFMNKCHMEGRRPHGIKFSLGVSREIDVTRTYIGDFDDEDNEYLNFFAEKGYKRVEKAQYLKACLDIIKENRGRKIMILSRTKSILGTSLKDFGQTLERACEGFLTEDECKKVVVKTVHTAKGEEADTVILLNVNKGVFPVFNPNNDLFEVFGHTSIEAVEDEERLYYVALTRAIRNLYIFYEGKDYSSFILSLN